MPKKSSIAVPCKGVPYKPYWVYSVGRGFSDTLWQMGKVSLRQSLTPSERFQLKEVALGSKTCRSIRIVTLVATDCNFNQRP